MTDPTQNPETAPLNDEPVDELEQLRKQLADAIDQAAAAKDAQLRAVADLENTRRRLEREAQSSAKYATEKLLGELIGVADGLELGVQAAALPGAEVQSMAEGMQMTYQQLMAVLEKNGVKQENPVGQKLNAGVHQAISVVESAEVAPNHVISVMQKGYILNGRVVRPAMVVVAKAPAAPAGDSATSAS